MVRGLMQKRVTAVSATLKNEVMKLYNVPDWKCDVVPNGIVPRQFRAELDAGELKKAYGIHPYAPLILFIGRLVYRKVPILLSGYENRVPLSPGCKLIVAGEGDMRQFLTDGAKDLPANLSVMSGFRIHPPS